jgi:hypothetical protein
LTQRHSLMCSSTTPFSTCRKYFDAKPFEALSARVADGEPAHPTRLVQRRTGGHPAREVPSGEQATGGVGQHQFGVWWSGRGRGRPRARRPGRSRRFPVRISRSAADVRVAPPGRPVHTDRVRWQAPPRGAAAGCATSCATTAGESRSRTGGLAVRGRGSVWGSSSHIKVDRS